MDSKEKNKLPINTWKNRQFSKSFKHALDGVKLILKEERNMRFHALFGLIPIVFGLFFQLARWEWILVITCIFLVIIIEFMNTIIETVVDMVTDYEYHPLAKKAKDIAAGAVLVTAIFTVVVAALIFIPKIIEKFFL